jgi:hypothetical protein
MKVGKLSSACSSAGVVVGCGALGVAATVVEGAGVAGAWSVSVLEVEEVLPSPGLMFPVGMLVWGLGASGIACCASCCVCPWAPAISTASDPATMLFLKAMFSIFLHV